MKNVLRWMAGKGAHAARHAPHWARVEAGPLAGCEFFLPKGLKGWAGQIVRGAYEPGLCMEIAALAKHGGTFYDIGAHIGFFSCAWLTLGGAGVESFEPAPGNAEIVRETLARNALPLPSPLVGEGRDEQRESGMRGKRAEPSTAHPSPRVACAHVGPLPQGERATIGRVHEIALGAFDGAGTLMLNAENLGKTSMAYVREAGGIDSEREGKVYAKAVEVKIAVRKLDAYARKHNLPPPRVLKIDVEGAEAAVLAGAHELLAAHKPIILLEIHNIDAALSCAERLTRLGYRSRTLAKAAGMPVVRWDA